jgi:hypothetical protein
VRIFEDWWLNEPNWPMQPAPLPPHIWPWACAQSSITARPCRSAIAAMRSMSAIWWPRCTGMIALVFGVIAASTRSGSIVHVSGVTSTMTGSAPAAIGAYAVAAKVRAGTITSSPQPIPSALTATSIVTVPFTIRIPCRAPWYAANEASNRAALGPGSGNPPQPPLRTVSATACTSRSSNTGHAGYPRGRTGLPPLIASSAIVAPPRVRPLALTWAAQRA